MWGHCNSSARNATWHTTPGVIENTWILVDPLRHLPKHTWGPFGFTVMRDGNLKSSAKSWSQFEQLIVHRWLNPQAEFIICLPSLMCVSWDICMPYWSHFPRGCVLRTFAGLRQTLFCLLCGGGAVGHSLGPWFHSSMSSESDFLCHRCMSEWERWSGGNTSLQICSLLCIYGLSCCSFPQWVFHSLHNGSMWPELH